MDEIKKQIDDKLIELYNFCGLPLHEFDITSFTWDANKKVYNITYNHSNRKSKDYYGKVIEIEGCYDEKSGKIISNQSKLMKGW